MRELLSKWPKTSGVVAALAVAASIAYVVHTWTNRGGDLPVFPDKAFYSDDDGATWFADSDSKVPPYQDNNGREAVLANVFSCDGGKHAWVQYLQKYTPETKAGLEAQHAGKDAPPGTPGPLAGELVKRPGPGKWIHLSDPAAAAVMTPKCPDGQSGTPQPVTP